MSALGNQTRYVDAPYFEAVGDNAKTSFALSWQPGYPGAVIVVVGGVPQPVSAYQISGYNIILSSAPATGARILVFGRGMRGVLNQPASGSVVSESLDQGALVIPATAIVASNPATGLRSTALATMQKFSDEFGASFATTGWQKLPSGLIIQWGYLGITTPATGTILTSSVTFPIAFQTACLDAVGCLGNIPAGTYAGVSAESLSTSSFNLVFCSGTASGVAMGLRWFAIGK